MKELSSFFKIEYKEAIDQKIGNAFENFFNNQVKNNETDAFKKKNQNITHNNFNLNMNNPNLLKP